MVLDIDAPEAWRVGAHGCSSSPVILTFPPMTPLRLSCNFSLLQNFPLAKPGRGGVGGVPLDPKAETNGQPSSWAL